MNISYPKITELCRTLALEGGLMAHTAFTTGFVDSTQKSDKTYLTEWDKKIEQYVREKILQNFPTHSIMGEELPDKTIANQYKWYIDPIDGTSNFVAQVPLFCTMIGVTEGTELIASAIYIPSTQNLYLAGKNNQTTLNGKSPPNFDEQPLNNHTLVIEKGRIKGAQETTKNYINKNLAAFRSIRCYGTIGGGLAMMVSGKPTTHIILGANIYDLAPVAFLYKMAGLAVVNKEGNPWEVADTDLIATPQSNLDEVLETFK